MKKLIKEHDLYSTSEKNRWEEIINSAYLKTAAASGCFGNGYIPNQKTPDFDIPAVLQIKQDDITGLPVKAFHTDKESTKNPGLHLTYLYTGDSPNYEYVAKKAYDCKQLKDRTNPSHLSGVSKELYNLLTSPFENNGLGYKGYGDVKGNDIIKYELVNVKEDPDLKEGGKFYNQVSGFKDYFTTMQNQGIDFWLWKLKKGSAPAYNVGKQMEDVEKFFRDNGYEICGPETLEGGRFSSIDVHKMYPSAYGPNTFMCKAWDKLTVEKQDCISAIDSYYEETKKYQNSSIKTPARELAVMKTQVNRCLAEWYDEKGFKSLGRNRRKKMEFLKSIRGGSPFYLEESKDKLTNIIRESLFITKLRKKYQ